MTDNGYTYGLADNRLDWVMGGHTHGLARIGADCAECGGPFRTSASRPNRFCSRACYISNWSSRVEKVCVTCGVRFSVPASNADRYQNCSARCRSAKTLHADCPRCGRRFLVDSRRRRRHCSESCRRPPSYIDCETCGKRRRVTPSEVGRRRHCSFACYRRGRSRTSPERNVADCLDRLGVAFAHEVRVGRYSVDFMLPGRVALEVDGAYWHAKTASRDARRDMRLRAKGYVVVRIVADEFEGPMSDWMPRRLIERMAEAGHPIPGTQVTGLLPYAEAQ